MAFGRFIHLVTRPCRHSRTANKACWAYIRGGGYSPTVPGLSPGLGTYVTIPTWRASLLSGCKSLKDDNNHKAV
eukprot:5109664-Pyramimonas_sp.AAC.1